MNWATIAPETRLYKGKSLFRWEDSPGLEHHCGVCAVPLHNSRAKTSCIGKHVEPCYRFHQQLHFVGKSHECFGCNSSDELHHNRHKEILRIVRQIQAIDDASSLLATDRNLFGKGRRTSESTTITTDTSSVSESQDGEDTKMTRRERKKAKKAGNNSVKDKHGMEIFPQEELDFISEAIHLTVHESKGAWEGTYVYDHKQQRLEAEEQAVIDDNDAEDDDIQSITSSMTDFAVKSPDEMTPRQRKTQKKFNSAINHSSYNGGSRKYGSPKLDPFDGVDSDIFSRLGIEIANPANNSKKRKELATKLVAAVKEDIGIIEREDADTVMREEGFWRWAGKTALHYIKETRKDFDWATGQKITGARRFEFIEEMDIAEAINEQPAEPLPEPEPEPQSAVVEDEFVTVVSKKPVPAKAKKAKKYTSITVPTKSAKKALGRPPLAFGQDIDPIEEEEGAEDFQEMVRRQQQKLAGDGMLGKWNQPPSPYVPPRTRGSKVLRLK
ncbi:uncharacterized protein PAC_14871 [Phialocephala subalpina]|uniref:Uncharacterized protein n=1 Tax=Phialocephala subalpina TaxID=576137 RepID=A0A1L7XIW4_9HELO|nr:uncharacterized protein PAC_14871 [Phialocephala subalpina]